LWIGSLLFLVGVFIAAWPDKDSEAVAVRASRTSHHTSAAD
jgi:hypothetical protein